jgi:hypothetical protein
MRPRTPESSVSQGLHLRTLGDRQLDNCVVDQVSDGTERCSGERANREPNGAMGIPPIGVSCNVTEARDDGPHTAHPCDRQQPIGILDLRDLLPVLQVAVRERRQDYQPGQADSQGADGPRPREGADAFMNLLVEAIKTVGSYVQSNSVCGVR